jgi:hypothetical protein
MGNKSSLPVCQAAAHERFNPAMVNVEIDDEIAPGSGAGVLPIGSGAYISEK